MKKFITLLLCIVMSMSMVACNSNGGDKGTTTTTTKAKITTTQAPKLEVTEYTDEIEVPQFSLNINGKDFTQADFADLKLYYCEATSVNSAGTESTIPYIGYKASDVLAKAGVTEYKNAICTASDGYEKEFSYDIFSLDTTLIAISKDDEIVKEGVTVAPCTSTTTGDYAKKVVTITAE